jgi:glycosyltransferase involved in cell wall biosynthesis
MATPTAFPMIDQSLRFCMITTFSPPYTFGGDGIFVHRLSNELAKRGHHVDVIHSVDAYRLLAHGEPKGVYEDHSNVSVHGLKSRFGFLSPLATHQTGAPFFKLAQIQKILDKGFDVIHYHNISLVGGPKIMEYGKAIKLYTMHEYWLVCPMHLLFRFNKALCRREHCFLCLLAHKRPPQWWRYGGLLQKAVQNVDAFIHLTNFSRDIHHQKGLELPYVHLPFFLEEEEDVSPTYEGQPNVPDSQEPYFLFVGRLEKVKGLQTLIPVFRRYGKAHLLIAGVGGSYAHLRKLAQGCSNIRFLGHLPYRGLKELYMRALAVIVPSLYYEISPLVMIEAFRHRTPVIARNLGGMTEIINESRGGLLYDNEEGLVSAMDLLLINPSYRNVLGQRGFESYKQKWTAEAHLNGYFRLIAHIAEKGGVPFKFSF